jgi:FKBP-type peptidyl-prolyl cis-trans isomerase FklB
MKLTPITLLILSLSCAFTSYAEEEKPSASPANSPSPGSVYKDDKDKVSYSIGADIGHTLKGIAYDWNQDVLVQGIKDVLGNKPMAMSDEELRHAFESFQKQLRKALVDKNKDDGKKFLDDNAKKPGVTKTASGLQYKVLKEGTGEKPQDTDAVEANYRGSLTDGREFDNSDKHPGSPPLPVSGEGMIKGWSEALKMMPVGSKWEIYMPAELGYGDNGVEGTIPPGSTLVFDIELLKIDKGAGVQQTQQEPPTGDKAPATKKPEN